MKKYLLILFLMISVILFSCKDTGEKNLLPEEEMFINEYFNSIDTGNLEEELKFYSKNTRDVFEFLKLNPGNEIFNGDEYYFRRKGIKRSIIKIDKKDLTSNIMIRFVLSEEKIEKYVEIKLVKEDKYLKLDLEDYFINAYRNANKKDYKVIHIFTALCDNEYQGIVKVSKTLGDGDNPETNLYWGSAYGLKTFFSKSKNWKLIYSKKNHSEFILERCIFSYSGKEKVYIIADAYRGRNIKNTIKDFLTAYTGKNNELINIDVEKSNVKIIGGGASDFIFYVGHNGLMDFRLKEPSPALEHVNSMPNTAILCCYSRDYFFPILDKLRKKGEAHFLISTSNLLAPEAYIVEGILNEWINNNDDPEAMKKSAADAYTKYQKCNHKYSEKLFVLDIFK